MLTKCLKSTKKEDITLEVIVVKTNLLKLLDRLGVRGVDPRAMYGGSGARYTAVTQMLNAGLISKQEAMLVLGLPGNRFI
jgi:hypothetical protein